MKLYSSGCPKCTVLEKKLKQKNISYEHTTNFEPIINEGIETLPVLQLDDNTFLEFDEAIDYVNNYAG